MHRTRRVAAAAAAALVVLAGLTACSGDADSDVAEPGSTAQLQPTSGAGDELADHGDEPCPSRLAQQDDPGYGFGTEEPADSAPDLAAPERAWVCVYNPHDVGGNDQQGATFEWVLSDGPHELDAAQLAEVTPLLDQLAPVDNQGRMCTADLGPRYALVTSVGGDLTGVVVDDFGCRDVRLTDDPFTTPPGDATQPGIVPGVLTAPEQLLAALQAATNS